MCTEHFPTLWGVQRSSRSHDNCLPSGLLRRPSDICAPVRVLWQKMDLLYHIRTLHCLQLSVHLGAKLRGSVGGKISHRNLC